MSVGIYLILLIVLLLFNLVFWVLVIWFRILFECDFGKCCGFGPAADNTTPIGRRNLGFEDTEDLFNNRPSTIAEQMESPPSYEEALKYDQFGFHVSPPVHTSQPSTSSSPVRSSISHQSPHIFSRERTPPPMSQSPPRAAEVRPRSATTGSNSFLTPIREEEIDDTPVTVVIDCIGVQASRLLENCENKIDLSGGEDLNGQSKC